MNQTAQQFVRSLPPTTNEIAFADRPPNYWHELRQQRLSRPTRRVTKPRATTTTKRTTKRETKARRRLTGTALELYESFTPEQRLALGI